MKHSWIKIFSLSLILFSAGSLTSIQAANEYGATKKIALANPN